MKDAIQEQLIAARRNQILDAAAQVFADKGFHPTTIKDIARQAGIADGTIYNYFENKTALLLGILGRMQETVMQEAKLPLTDIIDLRSFLQTYLRLPMQALQGEDFALFRVVMSEIMVNEDLRRRYHELVLEPSLQMAEMGLQAWGEQHRLPPEQIALVVRALSGMVLGLLMQRIMGDAIIEQDWDSLPDQITNLLLNGLAKDNAS
jgi:TetR/AcrR family fatty acid metabolism transcriptional regulator